MDAGCICFTVTHPPQEMRTGNHSTEFMQNLILLGHVFFGVICIVTTIWIFVDVLHANEDNIRRIRKMCFGAAVAMWSTFFLAGYWYVADYKVDKAAILSGPWPFAHSFFMETKEHLVIILLLLVSYLPIAASAKLAAHFN